MFSEKLLNKYPALKGKEYLLSQNFLTALVVRPAIRQEYLDALLFKAAVNNDCETIEELIKFGADANIILNKDSSSTYSYLFFPNSTGYDFIREPIDKYSFYDHVILSDDCDLEFDPLNAIPGYGQTLDIPSANKFSKTSYNDNHWLNFTPLMSAAQYGSIDAVKLLIKNGANINFPDSIGLTPIFYSLRHGHNEISKYLIENGASPLAITHGTGEEEKFLSNMYTVTGVTPLLLAARFSAPEIIELLIKNRAKVDAEDSLGNNAIRYAYLGRRPENGAVLLKNGAVFNSQKKTLNIFERINYDESLAYFEMCLIYNPQDSKTINFIYEQTKKSAYNEKSYMYELESKNPEFKKTLQEYVLECIVKEAAEFNYFNAIKYMKSAGDLEAISVLNAGLAAAATNAKNFEAVRLFIEYGADINRSEGIALSNSFIALAKSHNPENYDITEMLIKNGGDIDSATVSDVLNHCHPLIYIMQKMPYNFKLIDIMLASGKCSPDIKSKDDMTPLMYAAKYGQIDTMAVLIKYGANVNAAGHNNITPLMYAAIEGHDKAAEYLIEKNASIDAQNSSGKTALMLAINYFRQQTAKILIEKGANLDITDKDGNTARIIAEKKKLEIIFN